MKPMKPFSKIRRVVVFMIISRLFVFAAIDTTAASADEFIFPLTWLGRSTERADSVPFSNALGGAVSVGRLLPLGDQGQPVFDNGLHTPDVNKAATPQGNRWASWRQWHGNCNQTFEVRHLKATFTIDRGIDVQDFILFSPFYTAQGNIIPINDNVYVYLDGRHIGQKGTSYGAQNVGQNGTAPFANETDGWFQDGSFGAAGFREAGATFRLLRGDHTLDFVAEEWCGLGGNGIGLLNLKLVGTRVPPGPELTVNAECEGPLLVFAITNHGDDPATDIIVTVHFHQIETGELLDITPAERISVAPGLSEGRSHLVPRECFVTDPFFERPSCSARILVEIPEGAPSLVGGLAICRVPFLGS